MYQVSSWMKSDFEFGILMHLTAMRSVKTVTCSKVICCDASDTGYGSHAMCNGNIQSVGLWDVCDRKKSSTFREHKV